jgi:hypothetical protein
VFTSVAHSQPTSYDEVPYEISPYLRTRSPWLAAVANPSGSALAVESARALGLGCAAGAT